ncbi:MAG: hypothetical protein M3Z20_20105 [Chloroflexota bacterium]|nr:hypothetical protein [Chloroflexota bacterium]
MSSDQDRAASAIAALDALPLNELVYATLSIVNIRFPEQRIDRSATAADYAITKASSYLTAAELCEERRAALGTGARLKLAEAEAVKGTAPDAYADAIAEAKFLTAEAEVEWHFFTICARTIQQMLEVATTLVGVELDVEHADNLGSYGSLRNQFEHLKERLVPGVDKRERLILDAKDTTHLLVGFRVDDVGRITVKTATGNVVCEVNSVGVWNMRQAVEETFRELHAKCIKLLEEEFAAHPEKIPNANVIRPGLLSRRRFMNNETGIDNTE